MAAHAQSRDSARHPGDGLSARQDGRNVVDQQARKLTQPKKEARQSPTHYRARIELTESKFRNLPAGFAMRPGMRVVCDIKVGRRSILEYVLNPITRVIGESLREP